jgi:hypothetical protein
MSFGSFMTISDIFAGAAMSGTDAVGFQALCQSLKAAFAARYVSSGPTPIDNACDGLFAYYGYAESFVQALHPNVPNWGKLGNLHLIPGGGIQGGGTSPGSSSSSAGKTVAVAAGGGAALAVAAAAVVAYAKGETIGYVLKSAWKAVKRRL